MYIPKQYCSYHDTPEKDSPYIETASIDANLQTRCVPVGTRDVAHV